MFYFLSSLFADEFWLSISPFSQDTRSRSVLSSQLLSDVVSELHGQLRHFFFSPAFLLFISMNSHELIPHGARFLTFFWFDFFYHITNTRAKLAKPESRLDANAAVRGKRIKINNKTSPGHTQCCCELVGVATLEIDLSAAVGSRAGHVPRTRAADQR